MCSTIGLPDEMLSDLVSCPSSSLLEVMSRSSLPSSDHALYRIESSSDGAGVEPSCSVFWDISLVVCALRVKISAFVKSTIVLEVLM